MCQILSSVLENVSPWCKQLTVLLMQNKQKKNQKSKSEKVESTQKFLGKDWRWDTSFLEQQVCRNVVFEASDRFMPAGVALGRSHAM